MTDENQPPLGHVPAPLKVYTDLRNQILTSRSIPRRGPEWPERVWGALMEMGFPRAAATLACLADGTTSLYLGTGGGIIGAGRQVPVEKASVAFLHASDEFLPHLTLTKSFPLPLIDCVRFYVLSAEGVFTEEAPWKDLRGKSHELSPLYFRGDNVLTELRLLDESARRAGRSPGGPARG
ncbi:MAG TPA: hypothetical protein VEO56_15075 [Bacteroidota bacterium]|nr:hypothetical protein [Bacteroidota bacterium]